MSAPFENLITINSENAPEQKLSVLLKGQPGAGKTHAWLTFPGPIIACYTDKNMETVKRAMRQRNDITLVKIQSWSEFADQFVPAVVNRQLDAGTIVVDTLDALADMMWRDIQSTRDKLRIQDFGTGKDRLKNNFSDLNDAVVAVPGKPNYNVVVVSHISDVTDDSGGIVKTTCSVMGAFKDIVEALFDYVLLCESKVDTEIEGRNSVKVKRYLAHTIPPSRYHTCKAPGYFPVEISPTWEGIQAALALGESTTTSEENK